MKRKKMVLLGILLMGLAVLFVGWQAKDAFARNMTFEELLNFPPSGRDALAQAGDDILTPTVVVISGGTPNPLAQGSDPNLVPISLEQIKKNEAIIESMKILIKKADKKYVTAGWWHSVAQEFMRSDLGMGSVVLSDGSPAPSDEWKDETWTLLDEKGNIIQEVSFQDFGPTVPIQVGVFNAETDNYGVRGNSQEPSTASGFLQDANLEKNLAIFEMRDEVINDEAVVSCTVTTRDIKAVEMGNRLVIGGYIEYFFSKDTGLLLQIDRYDFLQDGQAQLVQRITTTLMERVDEPPAEVLKHLK
jgi:hypothetical protein